MNTYTPEIDTLATDWFRRCRESQRVHYEYGSSLEKRNYWLGVPTIILSTAVGTAVFASIESSTASAKYGLWCGLVSMAAAILAALQTFLNLPLRGHPPPPGGPENHPARHGKRNADGIGRDQGRDGLSGRRCARDPFLGQATHRF
jgi:hypothetical protein